MKVILDVCEVLKEKKKVLSVAVREEMSLLCS